MGIKAVQQRDVVDMHKILGHPVEEVARDTAKAIVIELTGNGKHAKGAPRPKHTVMRTQKYGHQGDGQAGTCSLWI